MVDRIGRVGPDGLADQFDRHLGSARLKAHHAEQMQRLGVVRFRRQDLSVPGFRLTEASGLMMLTSDPDKRCRLRRIIAPAWGAGIIAKQATMLVFPSAAARAGVVAADLFQGNRMQ